MEPTSLPPQLPLNIASDAVDGRPLQSGNNEATLEKQSSELHILRERTQKLATAIANSEKMIEELEQTKQQLAEARSAAELAHRSTKMMATTIFEGTHDAMIVLDEKLHLIAANRNARSMFHIAANASGIQLMQKLAHEYRSELHLDWVQALLNESSGARIELFKLVPVLQTSTESEPAEFVHKKHWIEVSISPLDGEKTGGIRYLLTAHDVTQRKQIEDQFQHLALHDNVTQLPNRRFFVKQVEALLSESQGSNSEFAVCFLDLDNFKTVNDTLGHEAGDQLLVAVANRIRNTTRNDCFLARFGGDEFALLIPNLTTQEVTSIGNRIVAKLREAFQINGHSVYVGASIGMTRYPDDADDVNGLMQNADVAMYSAKDGGRNRFHAFTSELADGIRERKELLEDLRTALDRRNIALEYQPKWSLKENRLSGCEALLRWERRGKTVSAAHLVEVAECSGLILPLGDLILEKAVHQLAQWKNNILQVGKMAINLSPRQLADRNFATRFQIMIETAGVSASSIEMEITETAMMENFSEAFMQIEELKKIGVSIAIDDFGTGYSSLSYLKTFPVSTLKIDRSFISDLPDDPKATAVAKAVLSLGHGLGLQVVAEGVETKSQFDFLTEAGCDQIQGYLLSHSLTPDQFENWANNAKQIR